MLSDIQQIIGIELELIISYSEDLLTSRKWIYYPTPVQ
jgi:hypothetical protein